MPPYAYAHPEDLLTRVPATEMPLLVALDGVTDPRNLGSVVRSAAALGAHGVLVPERRAAGVTAGAWKSSAGALARLPVARATNLVRALQAYREAGLFVVGLAADGEIDTDELQLAREPARARRSARRARGCPGWSASSATCACASRWPGRSSP